MINKQFLTVIFLFCVNYSFSQNIKNNFTLEPRKIEDFPVYKFVSETVNQKTILKKEYKYIDSLNFYGIDYKSFDNLRLNGFLVEPKKKGNYPVLIFNRGGNGNDGAVIFGFISNFLGKIASQGYVIIGTQLRGTSVSEGFDEFGGKDLNDVLSLFEIIDQLPNVDKNRIGVFGWSRGVMTNFLMLKKTNRIKTNISIAGPADLMEINRPEMFKMFRQRMPNYAKDSVLVLKQRSCLLAIDSIQNKKLTNFIIQGNKDVRVNEKNAFKLYNKLNSSKFTTKLLIYEDEDHGLVNVTSDLLININAWLKKYL